MNSNKVGINIIKVRDECEICMKDKNDFMYLDCRKYKCDKNICRECFYKIKDDNKCPYCRRELNTKHIKHESEIDQFRFDETIVQSIINMINSIVNVLMNCELTIVLNHINDIFIFHGSLSLLENNEVMRYMYIYISNRIDKDIFYYAQNEPEIWNKYIEIIYNNDKYNFDNIFKLYFEFKRKFPNAEAIPEELPEEYLTNYYYIKLKEEIQHCLEADHEKFTDLDRQIVQYAIDTDDAYLSKYLYDYYLNKL